jgi:hypothetical protein
VLLGHDDTQITLNRHQLRPQVYVPRFNLLLRKRESRSGVQELNILGLKYSDTID